MRVAFCGLGRLGLPIAAVLSQHHKVTGYDPDPSTASRLKMGHDWEVGLSELLNDQIALVPSIDAAVYDADVAVVCVQTPHDPELDGTHPTDRRAPFDLSFVQSALEEIGHGPPVVLMSTVLPGDCRKLAPLVSELIYAPAFPAMGTTIADFLNPEFVLVGGGDGTSRAQELVLQLLGPVYADHPLDWFGVTWETAELAKMAYNTAIGAKIGLANTVAWLADSVGADGGEVMRILSQATRRITSPAYLQPGLGDGGACHPRDQIALSWLARQHGIYDLFGALIDQRNAHSDWIASVAEAEQWKRSEYRPIVILGGAYKADSSLTDGSPAQLLSNQTGWPIVESLPSEPSIIVVGVPHSTYAHWGFDGHVVIDPWGIVDGAIRPGRMTGMRSDRE